MAIFTNNGTPTNENNVGQFGATDASIGAYKQAAEYAADAEYWAKIAEGKITDADSLIQTVAQLYAEGKILRDDITNLQSAFTANDARLSGLISDTQVAILEVDQAVQDANTAILDINKQLDILKNMTVVTTLVEWDDTSAGASYDPATGIFTLRIPKGKPGVDGVLQDFNNAATGSPTLNDVGFYVDMTDNETVKKTSLADIAKLVPSVQGITFNGGAQEHNVVDITPAKIGLPDLYSKTEVDNKITRVEEESENVYKIYYTKADALADLPNRNAGDKVMVTKGEEYTAASQGGKTTYDYYTVNQDPTTHNKDLQLVRGESRVLRVNNREPDANGNISVTLPDSNPSLWLGEVVMFPYSKGSPVNDATNPDAYKGMLAADGSEYKRSDYVQLVDSLKRGVNKWVTETEWQAGKKMYYSMGKNADGSDATANELTDTKTETTVTFRVPDWTQGGVFRTPDFNTVDDGTDDEDWDGKMVDQKPFITKINNLEPDELTGEITLTASQFGGVGPNDTILKAKQLETARLIAGKTFDGTQNVTITASDVGALGKTETASAATKLETARLIAGKTFDGTGDVPITAVDVGAVPMGSAPSVIGAAKSGSNSDITSLNGLTSAIPLSGGGTGATTAAGARANLGVAAVSTPLDTTPGLLLTVGYMGIGGTVTDPAPMIPNNNADDALKGGFYSTPASGDATTANLADIDSGLIVIPQADGHMSQIQVKQDGTIASRYKNTTWTPWQSGGTGGGGTTYVPQEETQYTNSSGTVTINVNQQTASAHAVIDGTTVVEGFNVGTVTHTADSGKWTLTLPKACATSNPTVNVTVHTADVDAAPLVACVTTTSATSISIGIKYTSDQAATPGTDPSVWFAKDSDVKYISVIVFGGTLND